MIKIVRYPDKGDAQKNAQACIEKHLERFRGSQILFLAAGGSALKLLDGIDKKLVGDHMTIGVTDERYSTDPSISNFSQLRDTALYKAATGKGANIIDTRVKHKETLEGLADRFDKALKDWRKKYPKGVILITQGIGPDGHTVGVMPFPENPRGFKERFQNDRRWAVGYDAENKNPHRFRVSVTLPFLVSEVDVSIVYAVGVEKREALERTFDGNGVMAETPARVLNDMKNVQLFTDVAV